MPAGRVASRVDMSTHATTGDDPSSEPLERPPWLEYEEFPFESRVVEVDGNRIHYVDEGAGPTLLFVHAGPAWSFVFRDVIEALRCGYRCVALDLPGTGLSEAAPAYEPDIEHAAWVLGSFVDALGIESATAVVHDVGGPVALGVAADQPTRFDGFVVVGSFGWSLNEHAPDVARFIRLVGGSAFRFLDAYLNVLVRLTATRFGVGRRLSKPGRRAFRAPYASRRRRRNGVAMLASAVRSDEFLAAVERSLRTDLADHPMLLLFGEHDEGREAGFQARWEELFPDARSLVVEGANHFPMADAPHLVADTIDAWHRDRVAANDA